MKILAFQTGGQLFAIERRKTITQNDISVLNIGGMKLRNYKMEIIGVNLQQPGLTAVIAG